MVPEFWTTSRGSPLLGTVLTLQIRLATIENLSTDMQSSGLTLVIPMEVLAKIQSCKLRVLILFPMPASHIQAGCRFFPKRDWEPEMEILVTADKKYQCIAYAR